MRMDKASLRLRLAAGSALTALALANPAAALPVATGAIVNAGGGQPVIAATGNLVTVDLNAQRTIIDWSNFNLLAGETARFAFDQRNWVVLNRVTSQAVNIDGTIQAVNSTNVNVTTPIGGNVWFYSPQGVAFGPNARVDVGGLLATSAAVDQTAFLTAGNLNIPFTGSGSGGPVTLASGAQFTGRGHLAFVAPRVTSGAGVTVNAGDLGTAAYGGVDSFEIQFISIGNNDLAFFTFLVPSAAAGTAQTEALNLAGQTTGANVYLLAMSRGALTSQLINAPGLLVGQSSVNAYGQVTITTGRNILLGQVNVESSQVAGVTTGSVRLGEINAGGNVNIVTTGTGSLGDITATRVRAGQFLNVAGMNITIPGGVSSGDRNVNARSMLIDSGGVVNIGQMSSTVDINIQRGNAQIGRTVSNITLTTGPVTVGRDFFVFDGAEVNIASITAAGQSQVFGARNVTIGNIATNGYTRVSATQLITLTNVTGNDLDLRSAGGVTANSLVGRTSISMGTGGLANITSITTPTMNMEAGSTRLGTVSITGDARIRTRSFDLLTGFTAANLTIEASPASGPLRLGGTTEPGITQAEFRRIVVTGALNIYAGQTATTINEPIIRYADIEIGDLSINPAQTPRLNIYANPDRAVRIAGVLTSAEGGGVLNIGMAEANSPWAPGQIIITGSIGTAEGDAVAGFTEVETFDEVELHATDDILIGSQRFVTLIGDTPAAQIDIGRALPLGVAAEGDEIGRLFVVAGALTLTANDRIVQQNTGTFGLEGGLYLTGEGVEATDPILTVGRAQVADLFGAFDSGNGLLAIGGAGAFSNRIVREEGDTSTGRIRINGCILGVGCALSTPASQFRVQQFRPAAPRAAIDPPVLTPPPLDEDEREDEAVITGAGNEEIWRRDQ